MTEFPFSEDELKIAASLVNDAMLDSLPDASEIDLDFSDEFNRKMELLCAKARIRERVHRRLARVAAVFVGFIVLSSVILLFSTEARASIVNWFYTVSGNDTTYHFIGESPDKALPDFLPIWIPDGFVGKELIYTELNHAFFYEDEIGNTILFSCYFLSNSTVVSYDTGYSAREDVFIHGSRGDFYHADETSETNNLIWIEKDNDGDEIVFTIDSNLEKDVILHIAESVNLYNMPNLK